MPIKQVGLIFFERWYSCQLWASRLDFVSHSAMADQRLLNRANYRAAWYEHLDRVLTRPQLAGKPFTRYLNT